MSNYWRALRIVLGLVLVAGLLVLAPGNGVVDAPPAAAASPSKVKITPAKPIRGETFLVTGSVGGNGHRSVLLQRKSGSKWLTISSGTTNASGDFELSGSTQSRSLVVRVVALAATEGTTLLPAVITATAKIRTTDQKAKLSLPRRVYVNQSVTAEIGLTPARNQRPVRIQVRQASKWVTIAEGTTGANGKAIITLAAAAAGKFNYRAMAPGWNGAKSVTSRTQKLTIKADKVVANSDARPLSPGEASAISSYNATSGTLILKRAPGSAKTISTDDILPIPPRESIPSGALRRVTSVVRAGSTTTIKTTDASLPEAITNVPDSAASVALSVIDAGTFEPDDGVGVASQAKQATKSGKLAPSRTGVTAVSTGISLELNKEFALRPGVTGSLKGTITLDPYAILTYDADWGALKRYQIGAGVNSTTSVTAAVSTEFATSVKVPLGQLTQVAGGAIGPVPVWVQNEVKVVAEISIGGSVSIKLTGGGRSEAGIENSSDNDLTPKFFGSGADSNAAPADLKGELNTGLFLGLEDDVLLYSAAGPFVKLGGKATLSVSWSTADHWQCGLDYGPYLEVGAKASDELQRIFGVELEIKAEVEFATTHVDCSDQANEEIGEGGGGGGGGDTLAIMTASLPNGTVGGPYHAALSATGGTPPYKWSASGLPAGLELSLDGALSGSPELDGSFSVTVVATDAAGHSKSADLDLVIDPVDEPAVDKAVAVATGTSQACAAMKSGIVKCWGATSSSVPADATTAAPETVAGLGQAVALAGGAGTMCALTATGGVRCWGDNSRSQLGVGLDGSRLEASGEALPVVGLGEGVKAISSGDFHFCALLVDTTVRCWGDGSGGRIGNGTDNESSVPVPVAGLDSANVISLYASSSCALTSAGVRCWGSGPTPYTPTEPTSIGSTVLNTLAGGCGVTEQGGALCWNLWTDQLDNDPILAELGSNLADIKAHSRWRCALTTGGEVKCWGSVDNSETGPWTSFGLTPITASDAVAVSVNASYGCTLTQSGAVKCWGAGMFGVTNGEPEYENFTVHEIPLD